MKLQKKFATVYRTNVYVLNKVIFQILTQLLVCSQTLTLVLQTDHQDRLFTFEWEFNEDHCHSAKPKEITWPCEEANSVGSTRSPYEEAIWNATSSSLGYDQLHVVDQIHHQEPIAQSPPSYGKRQGKLIIQNLTQQFWSSIEITNRHFFTARDHPISWNKLRKPEISRFNCQNFMVAQTHNHQSLHW